MRLDSTIRIRATRDYKSCLFKIVVIVKMQLAIIDKINRFVLQGSDSRAGELKLIQESKKTLSDSSQNQIPNLLLHEISNNCRWLPAFIIHNYDLFNAAGVAPQIIVPT